jgi:hypothetical protein
MEKRLIILFRYYTKLKMFENLFFMQKYDFLLFRETFNNFINKPDFFNLLK